VAPVASPGRRKGILVLSAIALVLVLAIAIAVGVAVSNASAPDPTPTLPAVEEPLGTHLNDLLDEVTP
jgi:hypothetical protein